MKRLNLILIAILILIFGSYVIFNSAGKLSAEVNCVSAAASEHPESFDSIVNIIKRGSAIATFTDEIPSSSDGLYLTAATVTLKNGGFCSADWIEAEMKGASGDIAIYSQNGTESSIAAGETGKVVVKYITRTPDESRTIKISYYILGKQRSITVKAP